MTAGMKCAPLFPHIEKRLYECVTIFTICRVQGLPVTCSVIQQLALLFRETPPRTESLTDGEREKLRKFTASKGWIMNFVKGFNLWTVHLRGEANGVDSLAVAHNMIVLRRKLEDYDLSCIFNVDETGLL